MAGTTLIRDVGAFERGAFDVLVVGGGVVGACIARDAARRGLVVALVEAGDFSCATSEAMSHQVHGGIRYMAQGRFGHLRQSLAERATWMRVAPHQVAPQPCLTPIVGASWTKALGMRAAVALFKAMGGDNVLPPGEDDRTFLDPASAIGAEPAIAMDGLAGALRYHDCRIDEPERIVLGVIKDAVAHGAVVANHVACTGLRLQDGKVAGSVLTDRLTGATGELRAGVVVNATGAWAGALATRLVPGQKAVRLTLSKGIHIVTESLGASHTFNLAGHGEHASILPWRGFSLIGTTDDLFDGEPEAVSVLARDEEALTAKILRLLPGARGALETIHARFASLRALPGATGDTYSAARESLIVHHTGDGAAGFFTACGGKWTTARAMAEEAVDAVVAYRARPARGCDTASSALPDAPVEGSKAAVETWQALLSAWPRQEVQAWVAAYGGAMPDVVARLPQPDVATHEQREAARFTHAVESEMAMTAQDVARRLARWYQIENPGVTERAATWLGARGRAGGQGV